MQFTINDKHGTRLRRVRAIGCFSNIRQRFDDVGPVMGNAENAIGQQSEITRTCVRNDAHLFFAVLQVMANRGAIIVVHACVHRKNRFAGQSTEVPIGRAAGMA